MLSLHKPTVLVSIFSVLGGQQQCYTITWHLIFAYQATGKLCQSGCKATREQKKAINWLTTVKTKGDHPKMVEGSSVYAANISNFWDQTKIISWHLENDFTAYSNNWLILEMQLFFGGQRWIEGVKVKNYSQSG